VHCLRVQVRKSAALLGYASVPGTLRYSEVSAASSRSKALGGTCALGIIGACLALPPVRWVLFRTKVLPLPGEGPSKELRETGHFHTYVLGVGEAAATADGGVGDGAATASSPPMAIADVRSGSAGDPGYKATAQMCVESALCLALQRAELRTEGGVLTPAAALGDVLVDRLNRSGMQLEARVLTPTTSDAALSA
jgi:short subunit dehydrogenase-like uncharacterized protein